MLVSQNSLQSLAKLRDDFGHDSALHEQAQRLERRRVLAGAAQRGRVRLVDVTALDVLDSFAARTLRTTAHMTLLRGAQTVLVGIQPEVAFAMVQLGISMEHVWTALDLEEGLALLDDQMRGS